MTNSTPLSPAAQAVLIAQAKERCLFEWSALNDPPCHPSDPEWNGCIQCIDRCGIAAALRALDSQLGHEILGVRGVDCSQIQLIAAELEGTDG